MVNIIQLGNKDLNQELPIIGFSSDSKNLSILSFE